MVPSIPFSHLIIRHAQLTLRFLKSTFHPIALRLHVSVSEPVMEAQRQAGTEVPFQRLIAGEQPKGRVATITLSYLICKGWAEHRSHDYANGTGQ